MSQMLRVSPSPLLFASVHLQYVLRCVGLLHALQDTYEFGIEMDVYECSVYK